MSELLKRIVFGGIYVAVIICSVLWWPIYFFGIIFLAVTVLGIREFMHLAKAPLSDTIAACVLGAMMFVGVYGKFYLSATLSTILLALYVLVLFGYMAVNIRRKDSKPLYSWGTLLVSQVWIALPFSSLCLWIDDSSYLLLALFVTVWTNDTGAYLTGTLTARMPGGNHKMCPTVSPKKSWEGLAGGIILSLAISLLYIRLGWIEHPVSAFIFTICVAIAATIGDLMESLVKRSAGVKDSGLFLPGHGGVLDRFDSILFAAPTVYIVIQLLDMIRI